MNSNNQWQDSQAAKGAESNAQLQTEVRAQLQNAANATASYASVEAEAKSASAASEADAANSDAGDAAKDATGDTAADTAADGKMATAANAAKDGKAQVRKRRLKDMFYGSFGHGAGADVPVRKKLTGHIFALLGIGFLLYLSGITLLEFNGDRSYLYSSVVRDFSKGWGDEQTLADPVIAIPSMRMVSCSGSKCSDGEQLYKSGTLIGSSGVTETALRIDSYTKSEGPFDVGLYKAHVKQSGYLELDDTVLDYISDRHIRTNNVYVLFHIQDYKALERIETVKLNGVEREPIRVSPYAGFALVLTKDEVKGLYQTSYDGPKARLEFEAIYTVRGSQVLYYAPLARSSFIHLGGNGVTPALSESSQDAFTSITFERGEFKPLQDDGSTSLDLRIKSLSSSATEAADQAATAARQAASTVTSAQSGQDDAQAAAATSDAADIFSMEGTSYERKFSIGNLVSYAHSDSSLFDTTLSRNEYSAYDDVTWNFKRYYSQPTQIKMNFAPNYLDVTYMLFEAISMYSILILLIVYVTLLAIEMSLKRLIARFQYLICGLGIMLFYALLLALGEYMSFMTAYIVCVVVCTSMISGYILAATDSKLAAAIIAGAQVVGHALTYTVVFITGFGLLISTMMMVILLGVIMFITRKINREA